MIRNTKKQKGEERENLVSSEKMIESMQQKVSCTSIATTANISRSKPTRKCDQFQKHKQKKT
ncbi:CLUMA_CG000684, isoform A [Clunio marinus]|uniref:CLUMA_CG000684, isoform A n=1 Tax=Clunio marinus TaxID=568069 RepID=A0A1J1HKU4_9DIPT|nr:CLUMA_CG000684, isoform A [Clunio marinus]